MYSTINRALTWSVLAYNFVDVAGEMSNLRGKPARPLVASAWARTQDVRQSLSQVMDLVLGNDTHHASDVHMNWLKDQLRPLFVALPKNSKGRLGHATVRYALHRHFTHHHGMYVKGLEPAGEAWNSSSPVDIMEDKVPGFVQHLFEEQLHDGFNLDELALFAASLEHFVHNEAMDKLEFAYRSNDLQAGLTGNVGSEELELVMDSYMMLFLAGASQRVESAKDFQSLKGEMEKVFPYWPATQAFLRETEEEVLEQLQIGRNEVSFQVAAKIVETITDRFGKYQDHDCRAMSKTLISGEERDSGRIGMSNFYALGWQFRESKEYLRQFGVLDETRSTEPYVIIPNYLYSMPNCLMSSTMYSVCCLDQCEGILRHLESKLAAPTATPEDIEVVVAGLPSPTVTAPRTLPDSLKQRLAEIATTHNGMVPLHGRLFSQWLHHAYPRECPYPAKSGMTRPLTADEWLESQNVSVAVSNEEVKRLAEAVKVKDLADGDMEATLPWDAEEELVYQRPQPSIMQELGVLVRAATMVSAISAMAVAIAKVAITAPQSAKQKACV